jgi:hypothetical protein
MTTQNGNKNELLKALRESLCTFTYKKLDGELRVATGTLNLTFIPDEFRVKVVQDLQDVTRHGESPNGFDNTDLVKYYDVGSRGWRSFHTENLETLSILT